MKSRRRSDPGELTGKLRAWIIRGKLVPGSRLTEESLASEFGVSRIPIREALSALASEGFVEQRGYRGTYVANLGEEEARSVLDVRAALEPVAASQAAIHRTDEDVTILRELDDLSRKALRKKDLDDVREINARFHERVALICGNKMIISFMSLVRFKMEWAMPIAAIERGIDTSVAGHGPIIEAIADGNPGLAAQTAAMHIRDGYVAQGWNPPMQVSYVSLPPDRSRAQPTATTGPEEKVKRSSVSRKKPGADGESAIA